VVTDVFVVRNQHGHYWRKAKTWVDGHIPRAVMRTQHRDEAINTLFELSSRDIELRGEVIAAQLNEKGDPVIEPSATPLPQDSALGGEVLEAEPMDEAGASVEA
jgi:hypothetical protein